MLLYQNFVSMRSSFIAFVVSCLAFLVYSIPFISSDQGNEEDFLNDSLYFAPIGQTTDDEFVSDVMTAESGKESLLESGPIMWQDYSNSELDVSLQPSETYTTDIIAIAPSKSFFPI